MLAPDRAEAERFLSLLDPSATGFTFQTFDDVVERRKARAEALAKKNEQSKIQGWPPLKLRDPFAYIRNGTLDRHWSELCRLNAQGAGVYVTIGQPMAKGVRRKTSSGCARCSVI